MGAQIIRGESMEKKQILRSFKWNGERSYEVIALLSVFAFLFLMWMFTGKWPFDTNTYNSYALQADSWRQGRLDLGQNYSWLELAIYEGKYFVSFPPFPSYLLFPFTFLFGSQTPDNLILCLIIAVAVIYTFRLATECGISPYGALAGTLLVVIGSNHIFVMFDASVWFFAQTLCFTLSMASLYYALKNKGGLSLGCWACAVGCRPMQIVFVPVLLLILYQNERKQQESSLLEIILKRWKWYIPPVLIGLSYVILNFVRFGNPLEFGHNYLPEFTEAEYGQFHSEYIAGNLKMLFHLPEFSEDGVMIIDHFGNLSMLIVSPIFVLFLIYLVGLLWKKEQKLIKMFIVLLVLSIIYMLIVVMHRTMGGWHFGNRYTNDLLPWIYLGIVLVQAKYPELFKYQIPLIVWGMCLNAVGSVAVYNGWGR